MERHSFHRFFLVIRPKLCGNCTCPQNSHIRKLGGMTVSCALSDTTKGHSSLVCKRKCSSGIAIKFQKFRVLLCTSTSTSVKITNDVKSQTAFACSNSTMETLEQCVNTVQRQQQSPGRMSAELSLNFFVPHEKLYIGIKITVCGKA